MALQKHKAHWTHSRNAELKPGESEVRGDLPFRKNLACKLRNLPPEILDLLLVYVRRSRGFAGEWSGCRPPSCGTQCQRALPAAWHPPVCVPSTACRAPTSRADIKGRETALAVAARGLWRRLGGAFSHSTLLPLCAGCSQQLHRSGSSCPESAVSISCRSGEKSLRVAAFSLAPSTPSPQLSLLLDTQRAQRGTPHPTHCSPGGQPSVISCISFTEVLALEKKCLVVNVVPVKYLVSR